MVKAEPKAKLPTSVSVKHASGKKITAFGKLGGGIAKKLAAKLFEQKKAEATTPADWPEGWIIDDRWCSWLPADWTPSIKTTEGRLLLRGVVGPAPERKHYFHKVDLEKHLGRTLGLNERGPKPPERTCGDFDPKMFVKRLPVSATVQYINDRLNAVHGKTVEEAVGAKYFHAAEQGGREKLYSATDLKYDIRCNRLELVAERPSQSSKPTIAPATPRAPGTPARRSAAKTPAGSTPARVAPGTPGMLPMTPARMPGTPAQAAPAMPATPAAPATPATPARRRAAPSTPATPASRRASAVPSTPASSRASAAPSTPASRRASAAPSTPAKQPRKSRADAASSSSSSFSPAQVFEACYAPLKKRAAKGFEDQKSILAIQGVGFTLGLEGLMLRSVPDILSQEPAERGEMGAFVMQQFEKALAKA